MHACDLVFPYQLISIGTAVRLQVRWLCKRKGEEKTERKTTTKKAEKRCTHKQTFTTFSPK